MIATLSSNKRRIASGAAVCALLIVAVVATLWSRAPDVTIGVEGRRVVEIAGPQLIAVPFTPGDALSVRVADVQPMAGGFRYDLRYMTFGPGQYDMAQSLKRPDGSHPEPQREFAVSVEALIPEKYSGELFTTPTTPADLYSGYSLMMWIAWSAWALMLVPLAWYGHKKYRSMTPLPPPPTVAQRLRDLLEQAARADLTVEQQADLEQLLLAFWSKRLNLSEGRLAETIEQLRRHPQAGVQWGRVERWLHSRATSTNGSVARELLHDLDSLK